jgi:hypothetical protein
LSIQLLPNELNGITFDRSVAGGVSLSGFNGVKPFTGLATVGSGGGFGVNLFVAFFSELTFDRPGTARLSLSNIRSAIAGQWNLNTQRPCWPHV